MTQLFGRTEKSIDFKGRLSIPKKMREELVAKDNDSLVMLFLDGCIQIFPWSYWTRIMGAIAALPMFEAGTRELQRAWGENVEISELDAEGRIILAKNLKEMAGIDKDVVLIGAFNRLEVWAKARYEAHIQKRPSPEDLARRLADKGIALPL